MSRGIGLYCKDCQAERVVGDRCTVLLRDLDGVHL
jgi:hypothetical protein